MFRRLLASAAMAMATAAMAPTALADCVGVDMARVKAETAKLSKSPPAFASIGVPELTGLTLNAERTAQAAGCLKGEFNPTHLFYTTGLSRADLYKQVFTYIQPRDNWISPTGGDSHEVPLTSGTELELRCEGNCKDKDGFAPGTIKEIMIVRASGNFAKPLTANPTGPGWNWTVDDLANSLFQPSAGRADSYAGNGRATAPTPVAAASGAPASSPVTTPSANCPVRDPNASANAAAAGANVGAVIGGEVLGGGYGRNVGSTAGAVLGGVFGGGKKKQAATAPNCP
jgi:hypothetical protein